VAEMLRGVLSVHELGKIRGCAGDQRGVFVLPWLNAGVNSAVLDQHT
jgi:hypothetical protein